MTNQITAGFDGTESSSEAVEWAAREAADVLPCAVVVRDRPSEANG